MGELGGTAWAMNISTSLLLIFAFLAFVRGQPRSPRQDGSDQIEAAETAELLTEEEVTPIDTSSLSSEDSSISSKGSSIPEPIPEPEPETETEPEPEPEGSGKPEPEGLEEPKPEDGKDVASQPAPSKKCQKCSRSAFRARHGEFCDGCGTTSSSGEMEDQALEKDAD